MKLFLNLSHNQSISIGYSFFKILLILQVKEISGNYFSILIFDII